MTVPIRCRSVRFVVVAGWFLLPSSAARAREPAAVEALIEQANDLRRQGKDGKALPLARKAYDLAGTARTAAQLGLVEVALGYWLPAEQHLLEALASTRDPWIHKNRGELERVLVGVRASIGELQIEGAPPGAEVFVNGQLAGTLPLPRPIRVGDGPVRLEVRARGHVASSQKLIMHKGAAQRVDVRLARLVERSNPSKSAPDTQALPSASLLANRPQTDPVSRRAGYRTAAWVTAAVATAALGVGVAESIVWMTKRDEFDNHTALVHDNSGTVTTHKDCGVRNPNRGGDACQGFYDDMNRAKTFAGIGYVSAAILAGGATTLFILAHAGKATSTHHAVIACTPTVETVGGACRFVF